MYHRATLAGTQAAECKDNHKTGTTQTKSRTPLKRNAGKSTIFSSKRSTSLYFSAEVYTIEKKGRKESTGTVTLSVTLSSASIKMTFTEEYVAAAEITIRHEKTVERYKQTRR